MELFHFFFQMLVLEAEGKTAIELVAASSLSLPGWALVTVRCRNVFFHLLAETMPDINVNNTWEDVSGTRLCVFHQLVLIGHKWVRKANKLFSQFRGSRVKLCRFRESYDANFFQMCIKSLYGKALTHSTLCCKSAKFGEFLTNANFFFFLLLCIFYHVALGDHYMHAE